MDFLHPVQCIWQLYQTWVLYLRHWCSPQKLLGAPNQTKCSFLHNDAWKILHIHMFWKLERRNSILILFYILYFQKLFAGCMVLRYCIYLWLVKKNNCNMMMPPYRAASFLKLWDSSFQPQRSTINNSFNFLTSPTRINQNPTRWKNQSSFDGLVCLCRSCRDIIIKLKQFQLKVPCCTLKWG